MAGNSFPIPGLQPGDIIEADQFQGCEPLLIKVMNGAVGGGDLAHILKGEIQSPPPLADPPLAVAIKVILTVLPSDVDRERIRRELAAVERARHRHILPFIATRTTSAYTILVSGFMKNGNMLQYIKANSGVSKEQLIRQVAEAVSYLHDSLALIHGNLKCQNVLISGDGNALLAGFSLSTTTGESFGDEDTATAIRTSYTLRFAAPELLLDCATSPSGKIRSKTTQTDVFAFGMLIVQVFTETSPWPGLPDYAVRARGNDVHPRPDNSAEIGFTDAWWKLCLACWRRPFARPSMAKVHSRISTIMGIEQEMPETRPVPSTLWLKSVGIDVGHVIKVNPFERGDRLSIKIVSGMVAQGRSACVLMGQVQSDGSIATPSLVAVKIIPAFISGRTIEQKLAMIRRVRHRYILEFLGTASTELYTAVVSPFMNKGNMLRYIKKNPATDRQALILQVAIAVDHLHRCGRMVHGDLKCQNVLISDDGCAQLADFGLAKDVQEPSTGMAAANSAEGKRPKTVETDVFDFGMLVLEAFTATHPWPGIDVDAVKANVTAKQTPPRPDQATAAGLSDSWWDLYQKCSRFEPGMRPSMELVQIWIHSILGLSRCTGCRIGRCVSD